MQQLRNDECNLSVVFHLGEYAFNAGKKLCYLLLLRSDQSNLSVVFPFKWNLSIDLGNKSCDM